MTTPTPEPLPPFPPEADWLAATPTEVAPDFVERTMARLRDVGLLPESTAAAPESDAELGALVAQFRPPAFDPRFVDRTFTAIRHQRADHWRRLLLRYEAPAPTPDFVARTMLALRPDRTASSAPWRRRLLLLLPVAAAALLLLVLRPERPAFALRELVAATDPSTATAASPLVLSHLLALAEAAAPPQPIAATAVVAQTEGGRR